MWFQPWLVMIFLSAFPPWDPQQRLEPFWTLSARQSFLQPVVGQPVSHGGRGGPIRGLVTNTHSRHFLIILLGQPEPIVTWTRGLLLCSQCSVFFTLVVRHHRIQWGHKTNIMSAVMIIKCTSSAGLIIRRLAWTSPEESGAFNSIRQKKKRKGGLLS